MRLVRSMLVLVIGAFVLVGCGDDDGGGSAGSFCDLAREFEARSDELGDIEDEASMDEALDAIKAFESAAPGEIKDDVKLVRESFEAIVEGDFDALLDEDKAAEIEEASANLERYLEEECGIASE
ncbi:MAG: hypothetical protein M5U14_16005 [Acidimicrobiia bacterium]|nr:hypothetical protein [Acidimicrobiia bacterium]